MYYYAIKSLFVFVAHLARRGLLSSRLLAAHQPIPHEDSQGTDIRKGSDTTLVGVPYGGCEPCWLFDIFF